MVHRSHRPLGGRTWIVGLVILLVATPLSAQDFLFEQPLVTFSVYGGWSLPGESSDLFDEVRSQLTLEEGDFAAPLLGAEAAFRISERLDAAVALEHASRSRDSEMRDWVTQDDQPIPQETRFSRTRVMGSVKAYLYDRGRSISQFAWVPSRWSPYLGAGAGWSWYDFEQSGRFVNPETADIFEKTFHSVGSGATAHALAGLDVSLNPRFLIRGEFRHIWGSAPLDTRDFGDGFDDVDLSESRVTLGIVVRR